MRVTVPFSFTLPHQHFLVHVGITVCPWRKLAWPIPFQLHIKRTRMLSAFQWWLNYQDAVSLREVIASGKVKDLFIHTGHHVDITLAMCEILVGD